MTTGSDCHFLLIETASNQRFIYDTNKLRESIGASDLLHRATTRWVLAAIDKAAGPGTAPRDLRDPDGYPRIEGAAAVEVVGASSGKAILLVRDRSTAEKIVAAVTLEALKNAPGAVVRGVIGGTAVDPATTSSTDFHAELKRLFEEHERLGADLPSPDARFQRLPVTAPCERSGLPAEHVVHYPGASRPELLSAQSLAKEAANKAGWKRIVRDIRDAAGPDGLMPDFHKNVTDLEKAIEGLSWVGLIHADGNGLGRLFLRFDERVEPATARAYIDRYRRFSLALDACTRRAFAGALRALDARRGAAPGAPLPVVPLVLGGDDLTALCDGAMAVRLAAEFTARFMDETAAHPDIAVVLKGQPLGVCAGVALIKPHYPFHAAYELARDLLDSAKSGKRVFRRGEEILPFAALDAHVHLDSSGDDLKPVRARLRSRDGEAALTVRPFVVRAPDDASLDDDARAWAAARDWEWLEAVMPVMPRGGGKRDRDERLPNSVLHDLRAAALEGEKVADARLRAVLGRETKDAPQRVTDAWSKLLAHTDPRTASLFVPDPESRTNRATRLLDALDLMDFWR